MTMNWMTILVKKDFISSKSVSAISNARLRAGIYYSGERRQAVFPIKQKSLLSRQGRPDKRLFYGYIVIFQVNVFYINKFTSYPFIWYETAPQPSVSNALHKHRTSHKDAQQTPETANL